MNKVEKQKKTLTVKSGNSFDVSPEEEKEEPQKKKSKWNKVTSVEFSLNLIIKPVWEVRSNGSERRQ